MATPNIEHIRSKGNVGRRRLAEDELSTDFQALKTRTNKQELAIPARGFVPYDVVINPGEPTTPEQLDKLLAELKITLPPV